MSLSKLETINVSLDFGVKKIFVGRLAIKNHQIFFEYNNEFLKTGLEISPFKLPLGAGLKQGSNNIFQGLFGVFNDSLPDAWGKLLLDRKLRSAAISVESLSPLDRLAYVGSKGMGALVYEPDHSFKTTNQKKPDYNHLFQESKKILDNEIESSVDEMLGYSGSAGGARPKILYENHIIKFPAKVDPEDIGLIEYAYFLMAKEAGIEIMPSKLLEDKYFASKRFDRQTDTRLHIHTASGLLHADHNYPSLDYINLMKLTQVLTKNYQDLLKVYRLSIFNVLAHNRDDHSKNFSFIMQPDGKWSFAPAYDLTFSYGPGGEHSMLVSGEGKNPQKEDLLKLAEEFDIKEAKSIFEEVKSAISKWNKLAKDIGVSNKSREGISKLIC